MKQLVANATLRALQSYVAEMEKERGFDGQSVRDKCLLLGEEVGELFKAVRIHEGLSVDVMSKCGTVSEELADLLIYLCAIANRSGVELEEAVRAKERQNESRRWTGPQTDHG